MASILRIANLCKTYYITNTVKQDVLKGINLELNEGELVALLGESGCGKSTLINIIGGLDTDYTGSVVVKGKFIRDFSEKEMDDYRKKKIGLIFQNYNLINTMTLCQNVEIAMQMSDIEKNIRRERALDLLDMVGLKAQADKMPNQLSGGQKQRVAIARALANNPNIILADEPTGALDKEASAQIIALLKKIADMGKLVIVVTHSGNVASECNRIIKIDEGLIADDILVRKPEKREFVKYVETPTKNIQTQEIAKISAKNLWQKKSRSLLVSLGISIGIAALIIILALSKGITDYVKDYFAADQQSTTILTTKAYNANFTTAEIENIKNLSNILKAQETYIASEVSYVLDGQTGTIVYMYEQILNNKQTIIYGNSIEKDSEIVVDLDFATSVTENGVAEVIGKTISINHNNISKPFTIVGIYDSESETSSVYISSSAMSKYYESSTKPTNSMYVVAWDVTYLDGVADSIEDLGFNATLLDDSPSILLDYIDLGTKVLTAVAAISTVVSAIMIIIVMYISVIERTEEIGILRSIGARKKDISKIFMIESSILGLMGGTIGLALAYLIAGITNIVCKISTGFIFISLNPLYYILGLLISVAVSALAGIAPARKGADLDPIEALRFE